MKTFTLTFTEAELRLSVQHDDYMEYADENLTIKMT